jgi:tetratricopeptide (TPR) repeat protein
MGSSTLRVASIAVAAVAVAILSFGRGARPPKRPPAPVTSAELAIPTATDGEIAIGNLGAQLHSYGKRLELAPKDPSLRAGFVDLLLTEGDFLGRAADYERAEQVADEGVKLAPESGDAYVTRASVRAALHRWNEALADLDVAQGKGGKATAINHQRASIAAARGDYEDALAHTPKDETYMRTTELASLGFLHAELGHTDEARRLLDTARAKYPDVSPFPLAWIDYHEGELAERHGDAERAKALYTRALTLLPRYAAAASHIAPMLPPDQALKKLEVVAQRSDDPEVDVARANALRALGRASEADERVAAAKTRYEELVTKHPEAYSDHAARFWLGPGNDPAKAYALAAANLENRHTPAAYDLAITTALMAKKEDDACAIASRAAAAKLHDANVTKVANAVVERCVRRAKP